MNDNMARDLSQLIKGRVIDDNDGEYRSAIKIDNGRVEHEPLLIVVPESKEDVAEVVKYVGNRWKDDEKVRLTTRCGGHSAAGYCLNSSGIVLDIRQLNRRSLDHDSGLLTIGMGNIWRDVYDHMETSQTGRIPVGGGCPGVGVAGFLLGSGFSFASRSYGLGSDNLKSLTVVKADGEITELSDGNDPELFRAMCGGGGGNFAIAVEGKIQTRQPRSESMMMGQVIFPFYRIEEVLQFYNKWVETLPPEMAVYGMLRNRPDPRHGGRPLLSLAFTPVFNGPFDQGVELLQPLIKQRPIRVELLEMTMPEWEDYIGSGTQIDGRSAYIRSIVTPPKSMNQKVARVFMKYMTRSPSPDSFVVWTHLGGAVEHDFGAKDGCFAFRKSRFVPEVKAVWKSSEPHEMRRNIEWAYDFFEELADASDADGAYLNYIDPLLVDWDRKYYGHFYDDLKKTKARVDPNGFFSFQQGIGSAFQPAGKTGGWLDLSPLSRTFDSKKKKKAKGKKARKNS